MIFYNSNSTDGPKRQLGLHSVPKNFDGLASDIDFSNKVMKYGHFHHPSVFPEAIRSVTKRFRSHNTSGTMLRR